MHNKSYKHYCCSDLSRFSLEIFKLIKNEIFTKSVCIPSLISECKKSYFGRDYRGTLNVTVSGAVCQRWDSQEPHAHKLGKKSEHFPWDSSVEVGAEMVIVGNCKQYQLNISYGSCNLGQVGNVPRCVMHWAMLTGPWAMWK